eukprot:TRINITY_DN15060_c1_g1_i1.p2 TRINITY_DN15060_c1_g1~~TRINITY_DN15060_c1_g1_i1.p2  ORF type:complete len:121 (-),score=37.95 TRINITY_DN15060_c1_g1_i1:87-449(-)
MPRKGEKKTKTDKHAPLARECTINLAKRLHGATFKKRAPRAVRAIKSFATEQMGTSDVRIDVALNRFLWARGVRNVPKRVRVRLERHRNEDEEAKEQSYTVVTILNTADFTGLQTTNVAL